MAHVLIVDDDTLMREMLLAMMDMDGISASGAENGNVALKLLRANTYDLIITDILMPEKEGIETIMEIKNEWPDLPIIAISGGGKLNPEIYLQLSKNLGARYSFNKPFTKEQMMFAVRNCLQM
jgi:DNA-binding NtrC family response regulator